MRMGAKLVKNDCSVLTITRLITFFSFILEMNEKN